MKKSVVFGMSRKVMAAFLSASMVFSFVPQGNGNITVANAATATDSNKDVIVYAPEGGHQIKNVIYMIPDGGGLPAYDVTTAVKEAGGLKAAYSQSGFNGTKIDSSNSYMYLKDYLFGTAITDSLSSSDPTDSAAAGTALATGCKTYNSYVAVDKSYSPKATILEAAKEEGMSTGLVVTSYLADATPAAFSTHTKQRNEHSIQTQQQLYKGINIMLGGGIERYESDVISRASNLGITLVSTEDELYNATRKWSEDKCILSTFSKNEYALPYDFADGVTSYSSVAKGKSPTLAEMTSDAIDYLSQDPDGFFLMVEGSKVDHAGHHGNLTESVSEYIAYDEAFKVALDFAKSRTDTVIVSVADHNTAFTETPGSSNMSKIVEQLQKSTPYDSKTCIDYISKAPKGSDYPHTKMPVGVFLYLPEGIDTIEGLSKTKISNSKAAANYQIDNTQIAPYLVSLFSDKTLDEYTDELFVKISSSNYTKKSDTQFVIKGSLGEATVYINKDIAIMNGKTIDLDGKINLYIDSKLYVSKEIASKVGLVVEAEFEGDGTKSNPYVIENEEDFLKFTNIILAGETYTGKYFKQIANVDMSSFDSSTYYGMGKAGNFYGNYDGQGHYINVKIESDKSDGTAVFPYTYGTIKNLGITGSIKNTNSTSLAAGLCRSAQSGAVLVNCYVEADISNEKSAGGICWTIYSGATVQNCYYKGKITASETHGIGFLKDGGKASTCYYQLESGSTSETTTNTCGVATADFSAATLNSYSSKAVSNISSITSKDQLCEFIDYKGRDFAFKGSVVKATDITLSYTTKDGKAKSVSVKDLVKFTGDENSLSINAPEDMNTNKTFTLTPVGERTADNITADSVTLKIDMYGFISCEVAVKAVQENNYYKTNSASKYSVILMGEVSGEELECGSSIDSEKIKPGESVTVTATASNGKAPYQFKYTMYNKADEDNKTVSSFTTATSKTYKLDKVGTYCIDVVVKDSEGNEASASTIEIQVKDKDPYDITGEGTKENPYVISTEEQYVTFINNMLEGNKYSGKYLVQTADLDMTRISGFTGIGAHTASNGSTASFDGHYDGKGHEINVNINASVSEGIALFPYTTGVIMNLGATGTIVNTAKDSGCAGISRSIREGGLIINCWSTVDLTSVKDAGGIAWTYKSGATAINCYYKGKIQTTNNYALGIATSGSTLKNCYYQMESGSTSVSTSTSNPAGGKSATSFAASTLNGYIESGVAYTTLVSSVDELCKFEDVAGKDFSFEKEIIVRKPEVSLVAGSGKITASWSAVPCATNYRVFTYLNGKFKTIGDTTKTNYTITGLVNGTKYGVVVLAYVNGKWTSYTNSDIKYATPKSLTPKVSLTEGDRSIVANWNAVDNATNYRVFTYLNGAFKKIADTTKTNYTITGLTNGTKYGVIVLVYVNGKWSTYTMDDVAYATPKDALKANVTLAVGNNKLLANWNKVEGATNYRVFTYLNGSFKKIGDTTGTSYSITGLANGTEYGVIVLAYVNGKWTSYTMKDIKYATPSASKTPALNLDASGTSIAVSWTSIENATNYRVFTYVNGKFKKIGDTTTTSYIIKGINDIPQCGVIVLAYVNGKWSSYKMSDIYYAD